MSPTEARNWVTDAAVDRASSSAEGPCTQSPGWRAKRSSFTWFNLAYNWSTLDESLLSFIFFLAGASPSSLAGRLTLLCWPIVSGSTSWGMTAVPGCLYRPRHSPADHAWVLRKASFQSADGQTSRATVMAILHIQRGHAICTREQHFSSVSGETLTLQAGLRT